MTPEIEPRMPWRVASAVASGPGTLFVRFIDGTAGSVDLRHLISSEGAGVFAALADAELFSQVQVELGVVVWPGELDLAPDAMYRAIKASGTWVL